MNEIEQKIKSILNLRSNVSIGEELANRQLEVISKSYQYLCQPENNIIYIADEVGLGKTYIAAGIAMLFRHFSMDPSNHRDVIIVPKKNLQVKWRKELSNFIQNNYLPENDIIHSQFQVSGIIKDKLCVINKNDPIAIFRMTSFSVVVSRRTKNELYEYLLNEVFNRDEFAEEVLHEAKTMGYFNIANEANVRKLVAYLINALSPKIDCLIIDEAHNYKYGLGYEDHDAAIRNEVTARFLGAVNDKRILKDFPELAKRVKFPLATKVICLSATPKDKSLIEIRNQFNCFINNHILSETQSVSEIKERLNKFLIRGNLEYLIEGYPVSRNQCRHEHREGNINKDKEPVPIIVEDGFESIFWQLLQYKSIKHLNSKINKSFEIGMLAGFESYQLDIDKKKIDRDDNEDIEQTPGEKEYEITAHRKTKESEDYDIIKRMIWSYKESFKDDPPPHPKMTRLEDEIIRQLKRQEKSLIFVRRVATAYELENRILARYEKDVVADGQLKFTGKYKKYNTSMVLKLLETFAKKDILEKLDDVFILLLSRPEISIYIKEMGAAIVKDDDKDGRLWLKHAYNNSADFRVMVDDFIVNKRKNISHEIKGTALLALESSFSDLKRTIQDAIEDEVGNDDDTFRSGYFFSNYFKKGEGGFYYRTKIYRENWFDINLPILNNRLCFLIFDHEALDKFVVKNIVEAKKKKHQLFLHRELLVREYITSNGKLNNAMAKSDLQNSAHWNDSTFLTDLLTELCHEEISLWIKNQIETGDISAFLKNLHILNTIIKNIFRNGSGLLPGLVADSAGGGFADAMTELLSDNDAPFHFVLNEIKTIIRDYDLLVAINFQEKDDNKINTILKDLVPVLGSTGQDKVDRGILAARFRMPGFPYVLVTTDIFREGEDLHSYCQNVYNYGIAWNPSGMEQRTGRIDRINSLSYRKLNRENRLHFENMIQVFYPYLTQSVEVNQVIELLANINKFIETFNEIDKSIPYESSVKVERPITIADIPEQITQRLNALYDIDKFVVY